MKKLAKPLILLLVVSLLAGAFIVGALAEDATPTSAVGSYTQPEGSWTPGEDHTGIVFGVWAAEADFLAGEAPDHWYTDGEFTGARIGTTDNNGTTYGVEGFIPGYVHCFGDVTNTTAQIPTGKVQALVINLAGKTLTNAKGFRIGGASGVTTTASVTFKNGTINHTGGQMQTRGNSTLIYDNVVYNLTGGQILYDDGCDLLEFRNSTLTSTRADTILDISPVSYGGDSEVRFVNTDLVFTVAQTESLFRFQSPFGPGVQNKSASVFFDKDSSLTRTGANLIALNHGWYDYANKDDDGDGVFGTYSAVQTVTFELGFTYSEATIPTVFDRQYYNRSTGKYSEVKATEEAAAGAENWLVINVVDGEETVTDYVMFLNNGMYELKKAPAAEDAWTPDKEGNTKDYTGITYGIWESEAAYLFGYEPKDFSTSEILDGTLIGSATDGKDTADRTDFVPGYVHLYANVKNTACVTVVPNQKLVINLGGFTLTQSAKIQIGGSSSGNKAGTSLTVKNGAWYKTTSQIQPRNSVEFIVENVDVSLNGTGYVFYGYAGYTRFTDSTVTLRDGGYLQLAANSTACSEMIFENTDIICTTSPATLFMTSGDVKSWNITFDAESSIQGFTGAWTSSPTVAEGATITINFESGFAASEGTTYPTSEGSVVVNKGDTVEICNHVAGTPEVTTNEAECGVAGSIVTVTKCSKCGEVMSETTEEIPALEHKYGSDLKCEYCGEEATPWTPDVNYTGIKYGAWESETDYLNGKAPTYWSTSANLDTDKIATNGSVNDDYLVDYIIGYVHCYSDVTNTTKTIVLGTKQYLVINLNGYTITDSKGYRIVRTQVAAPDAGLEIRNGNYIRNSGAFQCRPNTTLVLDNLNMTYVGGEFIAAQASLIHIKNCDITFTNPAYIDLIGSVDSNAGDRQQLIFENTSITGDGQESSSNGMGFLRFKEQGYNYNARWDVTFDAKSSISGNYPIFAYAAEGTAVGNDTAKFIYKQTITFEDGFAASFATYPTTYKFLATGAEVTDVAFSAENIINLIANGTPVTPHVHTPGDAVQENIVAPQCGVVGSYDEVVYCTDPECGEELSRTKKETPALEHEFNAENVCKNCGMVATPWTPAVDSGVIYAIWATELDYLLGNEPVSFSTSDVFAMPAGSAYVHCFNNINVSSEVAVTSGEKVVLNLGGKTLAQSMKIQITANATLTVKNGNWTHSGGQNQGRAGSTLIVENVNMTRDNGDFGFEYGTEYIRFTNCTINTANAYFTFGNTSNDKTLVFENTDVIFTGTHTNALFKFTVAKNVNITFDGNSSIVGDVGTWYTGADLLGGSAVTINFEDGFTLNAGVALPENATGVTVNAGEIKYLCEIHSFGKDENGDTACTVCGTEPFKPEAGTTYIIWSTALDYLKGIAPYRVSTDAEITGNADNNYILDDIPNGAVIVLYADVSMGTAHTYTDYSLTFDLNGHKLTLTGNTNMQLGYQVSESWKERQITFTSSNGRGTIDATKRTGNTFQARPGSIVLFENLDITIGGNLFNDGGAKSITMENCTLTGKGNFANTSGLGANLGVELFKDRTYTFDNTELYGMTVVYNYPNAIDNLTINFINGCILDNARANMFCFGKTDGTVNAQGTKIVNISDDTKFTNFNLDLVTVIGNEATVKFNVLDGETPVTNYAVWSSGEYYVIGEKTAVTGFSANLTLYSDFNLNFFGAENIVGVYYNGNLLESMTYGEKTKFTLAGITPDTAAETLKFIVAVKVGEETCYMPLNYSVLKYAETVVGDGTTVNVGTQLVSAVMNYVKAAYVYTGKTAPEFTGVAYNVAVTDPTGFAHSAIDSVQLVLGTEIGVRFNLDASYNGTVKIGDATYEVVNGEIAEGINYVVYNARAYQFAFGGIEVADADATAVYTLADYVAWAETTGDANLVNLVTALYEYSYLANEYKDN